MKVKGQGPLGKSIMTEKHKHYVCECVCVLHILSVSYIKKRWHFINISRIAVYSEIDFFYFKDNKIVSYIID